MKYFAMIDDRQIGPFELEESVREGVRPDTYVWCKGMPDWMQAKDVPDICRYFRQRLSGTLPMMKNPSQAAADRLAAEQLEQEELLSQFPPQLRGFLRKSGIKLTKDNVPEPDSPHRSALPVILYIVCLILILAGVFMM